MKLVEIKNKGTNIEQKSVTILGIDIPLIYALKEETDGIKEAVKNCGVSNINDFYQKELCTKPFTFTQEEDYETVNYLESEACILNAMDVALLSSTDIDRYIESYQDLLSSLNGKDPSLYPTIIKHEICSLQLAKELKAKEGSQEKTIISIHR